MQPIDDTPTPSPAVRTAGTARRGTVLWAVLALCAAADSGAALAGGGIVSVASPAVGVLAFLCGRLTARDRLALGVSAALLVLQPTAALLGRATVTSAFATAASAVLVAVLPWLLGRYLRNRAEAASLGWRRAELLERERNLVAEHERMRERARIAQEMHDSLGHELSLVVVRAGAMQVAPDYGERDLRRAAGEVRSGAAAAVERLQEIIGILRETGDPLAGDPLSQSAVELVDRARDAGMDVAVHGAELLDRGSGAAQRALCRVVQEALTNAAKHAPGAAVRVDAEEGAEGGCTVRVRNTAPRGAPSAAGASGGSGLAGLARRLRPLDGTIASGVRSDGGFEVVAHLPPAAAGADTGGTSAAELESRYSASQRRALGAAVLAPAGLLGVLAAAWLGYYGYVSAGSVLEPQEFARLRIGQEQRHVEEVLPAMRMLDPPSERSGAPADGARCRYYRSEIALPGAATTAYRLCFAEGRLAAKAAVPVGEGAGAGGAAR
ncbi:sensor histidine kinase [Streptomonospora wellingtoniae]|uniref:histidine kinase n=1 Tax=Streptomonospora wellingtoniae TaxID=3075544 RepID=A0ABU2KNM5_9ACTN|nr:histidine kinase [Streptomonospora sp. DSM 45055]MDT0300860.1 histidine kinase [Streptomonospora sp. DSM 45055]